MIVSALGALLVSACFALHPASDPDVKSIEALFAQAQQIDIDINKQRDDFIAREGPVPAPDFKQRLDEELKADRDRRDEVMRRAYRKTLVAYGLVSADKNGNPIMPTGEIVNPLLKQYGLTGSVTWKVAYRNPPPSEHFFAAGRPSLFGKDQPDLVDGLSDSEIRENDGVTYPDGVSYVWPDFVNPDSGRKLTAPAFARILHHELGHFKRGTNKETGSPPLPNHEEYDICKEEKRLLPEFGFTPDEMAEQEKNLAKRMAKAKANFGIDDTMIKYHALNARIRGFLGHGGPTGRVIDTSIPGFYVSVEQMGAIHRRADEIEERIASEERDRQSAAEAAKYARQHPHVAYGGGCGRATDTLPTPCLPSAGPQESAAAAAAAAAAPLAAHAKAASPAPAAAVAVTAPPFNVWGALSELAARGCADPDSVGGDELARVWPSIRPASDVSATAQRMGLAGCQLQLFLRLGWAATDGRHRTLSADDFAAMAREARAVATPPPVEYEPRGRQQPTPPSVPHCRYMGPWCDGSGG